MGAKFDKLKNKLAGEPGVTDPAGLAASIGRKKYGKANYDKAAAKDKSPKMKKADDDVAFSTPVSIDNDEGTEVDKEIKKIAKAMEYSTMDPIHEIQKTIAELGPEGLKKALPGMTEENKELLYNVLEDMNKSHKLPLSPPRKLTNVGGDNYVQEDVSGDEADEAIFDASVKEGDNEQKHQGGSHDQPYKLDWEGQMIKSLDEFTMEELATFGEIYKAMKMKKKMKKDMGEEGAVEEYGDEEGGAPMDKAVSASPKLWGKPPAKRGVGIYKGEEDDTVAEDVAEIKGKKTVKDVMGEAAPGKKDDILRELRDSKMKKAKKMMKEAMKKECDGMEGEMELDKMKKNMRKALISVLNEEYTDEEIEKAMKKGDEERYEKDAKYDKDEAAEAYEGRDDAEKKGEEGKAAKYEKDIEADMTDADYDKDMEKKMKKARALFIEASRTENPIIADVLLEKAKEMLDKGGKGSGRRSSGGASQMASERLKAGAKAAKKNPVREIDPKTGDVIAEHADTNAAKRSARKEAKMNKARELFIEASQEENPYMADFLLEKAKEMMASDIAEAKQVDLKDSAEGMNPGRGKGKVEEGLKPQTKADDVKVSMKKSIRYYGEPNDAFKAGRLGRHNYTSSVNEHYDAALYKAENPGHKEEELRKSYNESNINDLIEMEMTSTWLDAEEADRHETFQKSQGNFTKRSFDDTDMLKSLHMSEEEAVAALGEPLAKAKFIRKIGSGANAKYVYKMPDGSTKVSGGKIGAHAGKGDAEKKKSAIPKFTEQEKAEIADSAVSAMKETRGEWVTANQIKEITKDMPAMKKIYERIEREHGGRKDLGVQSWHAVMAKIAKHKGIDTRKAGSKREFIALPPGQTRSDDEGLKTPGRNQTDIDRILGRKGSRRKK